MPHNKVISVAAKKKSLCTARYFSREKNPKHRGWVEKRIQFMNMWFQNSLLWMKSAATKSAALRLMLERLHIKSEWRMEDREISTWLVLNILRIFPPWYLATGIKVTVRVLPCSISLSLCVYLYFYVSVPIFIHLGDLPDFHDGCSCVLRVHSKPGVYVGNLVGNLSPGSGRPHLVCVLSSHALFLQQTEWEATLFSFGGIPVEERGWSYADMCSSISISLPSAPDLVSLAFPRQENNVPCSQGHFPACFHSGKLLLILSFEVDLIFSVLVLKSS